MALLVMDLHEGGTFPVVAQKAFQSFDQKFKVPSLGIGIGSTPGGVVLGLGGGHEGIGW